MHNQIRLFRLFPPFSPFRLFHRIRLLDFPALVPTNNNKAETYTGLTDGTFKKRHYGHDHDMKEENKDETGTTLSRHIHKLRETGTNFNITWDLLEKSIAGYNPTSRQCRLCLLEKFHIMFTPGVATLNKRREIYTPCMHRDLGQEEEESKTIYV